MNANKVYRTAMARPDYRYAVAASGLLLVAAIAFPGVAHAQQPRQSVASNEQQTANNLSPATIRMIQHSLIQGGYGVSAADGIWGPDTSEALREFQRVKGLEATGRPDAKTLEALGVTRERAEVPGGAAADRPQASGSDGDRAQPMRKRTPADLDRETIRAIQQALDKQGLQVGPVDGVWGDQTTAAIANLQRAHGLPASGELDAHTLTILGLLPGEPRRGGAAGADRPPRPHDLDPSAIRLIQQRLGERGYDVGRADGVWGRRTTSALREFQRNRGLEPSGDPDVHTLAALGLLPGS